MKNIFFFFLIAFSITTYAQDSKQLIGKWKYEDVYQKEKLDEKSIQMIQQFFTDMTFEFKDEKNYEAFLMGKTEIGNWKIKGKIIEMTSEKGKSGNIEIIDLKENRVVAKIGSGTFILVKTI